MCSLADLHLSPVGTNNTRHGSCADRMFAIRVHLRDLLLARESFQDWSLHFTATWRQELGSSCQRCHHPKIWLAMGFWVSGIQCPAITLLIQCSTLAIISIVCFILMFLFTPESYWDRASSHIGAVKSVNPKMHHGVLEPVAPEIDRTDDTSSTQDADNKSSPEFVTGRKSSIAGLEDETRSYTDSLRLKPQLSFLQRLKPYNGRLRTDGFLQALLRPFVLFAYPAVLWSAVVYSCSVGWLIVLSESVAEIYRHPNTYNFSALATGLIYISPFVGGVLGSVLAGKISDLVVRYMAKKNGGLFEPEFRLILSIPVLFTTVIGLMGFGWSAEQHDHWIVPTMFFGIISFGCSLGSTTAITFVVDSYRQYASEALVTLNFSKNVFHGLVFSLFVNRWLEHSGSKMVFIWLGVIQLIVMISTIPMYIFGKRARMWTLRKNFMRNL